MYSTHGLIRGKTQPPLFVLLPGKQQIIYEELFRLVEQHAGSKPTSIKIHFERAVEKALNSMLPQYTILGCFFHFKEYFWQHICISIYLEYELSRYFLFLQELGLKKEFLEKEVSRRAMTSLSKLAFICERDVMEEFNIIKEKAPKILDDV
jgi:hypothetical protein